MIEVVEEDDSSGEEAESDITRDDEGLSLPMPKEVFTCTGILYGWSTKGPNDRLCSMVLCMNI